MRHLVRLCLATFFLAITGGVVRAEEVDSARVLPTMPTAGDSLLLVIEGEWAVACPPIYARSVSVDGREVEVLLSATAEGPPPAGCATVVTPYRATVDLGVLDGEGPYDVDVLLIDTPFLPSLLTRVSFEVAPASRLRLEPPDGLDASELGQVVLFGHWLEGCVPHLASVERSGGAVDLVSHLRSDGCGDDIVPFAQAFLLPPLSEGTVPVRWVVEEQHGEAGTVDRLIRESLTVEVAAAKTRPRLANGRFEVEVRFSGDRLASVAPGSTTDTALFTFFDPGNLEMQVKVLDGCALNNHFWVFGAASTDLEFRIEIRDLETGEIWESSNPAGVAATAINDTAAFPCTS